MKTMAQKIIDAHTTQTLHGEPVISIDKVFCHEVTTPAAIRLLQERGNTEPFAANQVKAILDHVTPSKDTASAKQAKTLRDWAHTQGVEFFDVGNNGVGHVVFAERGEIKPGMTVIMGDSHTCTHGAFGAYAFGVGTTDLALAISQGKAVVNAPASVQVEINGALSAGVEAKDVALCVIKYFGVHGATDQVLEFTGSTIEKMVMEERTTLCNMMVECGATTALCPIDTQTFAYFAEIGIKVSEAEKSAWKAFNADINAPYTTHVQIDVSTLEPSVTWGDRPDQVVALRKLPKTKVNQVWIGSCTNGRISDLRKAAQAIRGAQVAEGVRAIVTPASTKIWQQALREGLLATFAEAGFCVTNPGCGACIGMSGGVMAPGEVCASTSNRNFAGRMGAGATVHLLSPISAVRAAIQGYIGNDKETVCG